MALLRTSTALLTASLGVACGAGELGHVEVDRAVPAPEATGEAETEPMTGVMFGSRQSSRFSPDGLLLYFELELDEHASAQLELDLPTRSDDEPTVRYTELREDAVSFESDAAGGVVELAQDLDGQVCACTEGRFALRVVDFGADGERGTSDDASRELRDGLYYFGEHPCHRAIEPIELPAELEPLSVVPTDPCASTRAPTPVRGAASTTRTEDLRVERTQTVIVYEEDPDYDDHVTYVDSCGCGCGGGGTAAQASTESSGCGGSSSAEDSESSASGCEGDDTESSSASGCEGDDASKGDGASSGCDDGGDDGSDDAGGCGGGGDDEPSSRSGGCEQDSASAQRAYRNTCASVAPTCHRRSARALLSGPMQNYLWIGLALLFTTARARRSRSAQG